MTTSSSKSMFDKERMDYVVMDRNILKAQDSFLKNAYQFIDYHREEWSLSNNVDLEVTNHVLRVRIQDNTISEHRYLVDIMCTIQHEDGGWGDTRDDSISRLRSSAFCGQMLLRANRVLKSPTVTSAANRVLAFILSNQKPDGSWRDHRWHQMDATSVSLGTLIFAIKEIDAIPEYKASLDLGMEYIYSQRSPEDYLWHYKKRGSPVTISAHLLQKCAMQAEYLKIVKQSTIALMELQDIAGYWDNENVDHTCDAIRCLMLCASRLNDNSVTARVSESAARTMEWLLSCVSQGGGVGDRPGRKPHVERTCDVIDTVLKTREFGSNFSHMHHFWQ